MLKGKRGRGKTEGRGQEQGSVKGEKERDRSQGGQRKKGKDGNRGE